MSAVRPCNKMFTERPILVHCFLKLGETAMVKTITVGNYVSIQGMFVRDLADGRIVVRVGQEEFVGRPVLGKAR